MKHFFFLTLCLLGTIAAAQPTSYGSSSSTPSEMKATILIRKVSETVPLSEEQVSQLIYITSIYWEDLQNLQGQKNYEEKVTKLTTRRDKELQKILPDTDQYEQYQKQFEAALAAQRIGYNRRR